MKKTIKALFIFLIGVSVGVGGFGLFLFNADAPFYLREKVVGGTPQDKVGAYVQAIIQKDRSVAMKIWDLSDLSLDSDKYAALQERRKMITSELLQYGIQPTYLILRTEWWTTCCEPSVTCDSHSAGGARMYVQFLDSQGQPLQYVFDVFTREQPYWGAAMGYPPRHWVIRDIYPSDQQPLYWPMIFEPNVRFVDTAAP